MTYFCPLSFFFFFFSPPNFFIRVFDLGEAVCGIDRGKPAGHHGGPGEAAHAGASQARPEHVFDASCNNHMPALQHHDA